MDILTFNLRPFKNLFYAALVVSALATLAAYVAGANVFSIVLLRADNLSETRGLLLLLVVAAILQTAYQKKLLKKLKSMTELEAQATLYLKIYRLRLYWKCCSCLVSCFIHLLTGRNIFLYFAIFDLATTWTYFPDKTLVRKELNCPDVLFVEDK
jgi:hypothetical protein